MRKTLDQGSAPESRGRNMIAGVLRNATPRILAGASALVLTAAAVFYAPIVMGLDRQSNGIENRTAVLLAVLVISAASTWLPLAGRGGRGVRVITSATCGFNLVWIVSVVGIPVVTASLLGAVVAVAPGPRRFSAVLIAVVAIGFGLGLLLLRLTEPPGEHIFG
jgi:hypothetical protein